MKVVVHLTQAEGCELIAAALATKAKTTGTSNTTYKVEAIVTPGYDYGPMDNASASIRFEATELETTL